jgi:hypothetical protein
VGAGVGGKKLDALVRLSEDMSRRFEKKAKMASEGGLELKLIFFMQEI